MTASLIVESDQVDPSPYGEDQPVSHPAPMPLNGTPSQLTQPLPPSTVRRLAWITGVGMGAVLMFGVVIHSAAPAQAGELIAIPTPITAVEGGQTRPADSPGVAPVDLPRALAGGDTRVLPVDDAWLVQSIATAFGQELDGRQTRSNNRTKTTFTEVTR